MSASLYLVDGYSIIYQSYFAFLNRPLTNPQGKNTQAVFGFFRALFELLRERKPGSLAVLMDSKTKTHRHELYPEYKAHREAAPQELYDQVAVIEEILAALGVPFYRVDGYEADDLIAALAARAREKTEHVYIVSRDKDLLQTVGPDVTVLRQKKGAVGWEEWGREEVFAGLGVYPEQVVDYLALTGDQSDNVPGVAGVGPKTAVKLLAQWKTLDAIYDNLPKVPESQRKKLESGRENARLSKRLVVLETAVPLAVSEEELVCRPLDAEKAAPLFLREGMKSLARELGGESPSAAPARPAETAAEGSETAQPLETVKPGAYRAITDKAALQKLVTDARRAGTFAFDSETVDLEELGSAPVGFSLSLAPGHGAYVPVRCQSAPCLGLDAVLDALRPLLGDPGLLLVGQNIKYDFKVLKRCGLEMKNRFFDTMIAGWLLESDAGPAAFSLDSLAEKYLSYRTIKYEEVVDPEKGENLSHVGLERSTEYAAEDADIAFRLFKRFEPLLAERGLDRLCREVEMPVVRILADMELAGIRILPAKLEALSRELESGMASLEREIHAEAGKEFNIGSPKQLQEVLFTDRKLPPVKKIKTGFSTDNQVLEALAPVDRVAALVLDHRSLAKLKNTYADTLPSLVNPATGRIHTRYLQTGTATGRLSSKDPNLQNIPVRDEAGRAVRRAFVPGPDMLFLSADYSQIELAVLAHLSGDPLLCEAFRKGTDVHALTASIVFNRPVAEVTQEERRMGKTINFGVVYGMSAFRLSRDFKISKKQADDFIAAYFTRYASVQAFREEIIARAEKDLYVSTLLGRRRKTPAVASANRTERAAAQRVAFNTVIQGSAADIVKSAMRDIASFIAGRSLGSRLLLQVHDELILEAPETEAGLMKKEVRRLMEAAVPLSVPLRVNIDTGESWGDIH
ncbi:MAG: DNA polymerase I [Spirochaetales bacterium]|nr:DNA polymerase I [Spirochaetales bacterium]